MITYCRKMTENRAYTRDPLAIESANSLRFFAALSIESAPFYRMAGFLGIPRKRSAFSAFYRKRKFLESAEQMFNIKLEFHF